jgi:voltage-gated potassium channel
LDDARALSVGEARPFYTEKPDGRIEHRAELAMFALALLVIPAILFEEASAPWLRSVGMGLNVIIWLGFATELAFVLAVSRHRSRTLSAHWLDAAIVIVSFPLLGRVLQSARAFRLLRLLRLTRLALLAARANRAARQVFSPEGFHYVALLVLLLVVVSGAALAAVDSGDVHSVQDGIWWAVVTVTTVGYGDVVPHTAAGRGVATVVMFVGIGFVALLTATVAAKFVKEDRREEHLDVKLDRLDERLARLERALLGRDVEV